MENNEPQVQSWDDEVQVKPLAPTKESAVVTAANQKQTSFMSTSDKQTSLLNTAEQKKKGIQRDTDPVNRIDTNKVSFDTYRSMFPPETSILDIQIDYHKNKMLDNQTEYVKNALVNESFRDRSAGEIASDTALSLGKNTVTIGQAALGLGELLLKPVLDNGGDQLNRAMGAVLGTSKALPSNATKQIDEQMSTKVQAQQELVQKRVAEVAERNKAGIAALGDKATWWDDAKSIGSETSETISALIDNPSAAADVALSSALAFTVPALVSKGLTKAAIKNATPDDIAKLISSGKLDKLGEAGSVIGTAGLEGFSQAYEEKQKVLDMPVDTLRQNSKEFQKLESQHGEAKAKQMIADSVFQSNLGLTALLAGVASKVSGAAKLERDLFIGSNTITAMGKEIAEESSQSLTGQGVANLTEQRYVDNSQTLSENVGQAIGTGIVGAALSTGALSGTAGALSQLSKGSTKVLNKVANTAAKQQELDSILVEVATTGDFSKLDARTDLSAQDKMDLVLDPKVLGNASEETFEKITSYVQKLSSEKPPAERTVREDTAAETISNVRTKMDRDQIEPILGDLSSFDPDKEDVVLRKLGSSPDAFNDDELVTLMDHVSEENRPLLQSHIEARNAIAEYESTNNKTIDDVHNDVMVGSKGYRGINDFIRQFKSAISTNSDSTASTVLDSLNKFAVRQSNKLTDMTALMQLQKTEGNSPRYLAAMQNYRERYNVPAEDSIHRGSGKLVDKLTTEVKALSAVYDSLGMSYQYNTKQSYAPLQADTISTIIPAKVAVTPKVTAPVVAPKAPQSVATAEPSPSTVVVSTAPVVDSTQQDRAEAEARTAALKARVGAKLDAMSETKVSTNKKSVKTTDIASDEVSDIRRTIREQQDAPSKLLGILMKYNSESSYIYQLAKKLKNHSLIDNLSFGDAVQLENRADTAGGNYSPTTHSVTFKDSVFKEIFRGLTDRVPFAYITDGTDPNSEEGLTAAPYLVLHELIHAVTVEAIANAWKTDGLYEELLNIQSSIKKWVKNNKEFLSKKENSVLASRLSLILEKEEELVTYGLTDVGVINLMKQLPSTKSKNLYTQFVALIRSIIGISDKDASLFDDILSLTEKLMDTQNKNKSIAPVEEAKPTASSEAAVAGKAVADDTNEVVPKEEDVTEDVTEPSEEPMNKAVLAEAVQREVAEPIIKAVNTNKRTVDKGKLKEGINSFTKTLTKALGKVSNAEIVQKLKDFSKGVQDAVKYTVDTKSDNESYKAGVLLAKKSFKFNLALDLVRNTVHNNLASVFFKPVNKNNALSNYNDLNNFLEDKLDQFGIKNPASVAVVNNFKEFHEKFKASLLNIYKPAYNTDAMVRENDYFHLLTNEDGSINENVIMAMSATAYGWLSDGSSTIIEHDDKAINNLLGFDENQYVPPKLFEAMSKVGLPASEIGDQLGSKTLSTLGLKFNDSGITEAQEADTASSIGVWVVSAMQDAGFVTATVYGAKEYLDAGIPANIVESYIPTVSIKSKGRVIQKQVNTVMYIAPVTKEQKTTIEEDGESKEIKFTGLVDLINTGIGLQREERRSLADDENSTAMETLFGITTDRPEPSFKKPTKARATVRKTGQDVSTQQQKDMLFQGQQAWGLTDTFESLKSMDVGLVKRLMGFRTEDEINAMHITKRAKAKAKSQGIERTIESLWSFASRVNGRDFYINLDPWVNTRMGYATNLDPQGNKEVRRLIGLKENRSLVDFNNPEHILQFRLAVMDAFGIKLNWKNIDSSKLEDVINDPVINAAIETLKTDNPDGELLVAAVDKLGTGLHGYQGLLAVSKMTADKPFETDLILESDGVSNGVAIAMWQFAGARGKQFADAMHRVGIYRNTDGYTTYTQWAANPKNLDSYQALAKTWDGALQYFKDAVLGDKTLGDKEGSLALYSKKAMYFKVKDGASKFTVLSGSKNPVEVMNNLNLLVGDLTDKMGDVTKDGRDLAKPITMRNIYSAGKKSLVKAVVDSVIGKMHDTLSKADPKELEKLEYLFNELFDTAEIFSTAEAATYIRELDFYGMTVSLNGETMTVDEALFELIDNSYGVAMEGAMHSLYGRLLDNRAVANEAAEYAFYVFDEVFKIAEQQYKDKHGIANLSIAQRNEVLKSIKNVIPVGLTPSADDKYSSIALYKEKTTNTYDKAYEVLVSFRNAVEGRKTRKTRADKLSFEAFGVGFIPVGIQVIDAHTMMNTLGKYPLLNVHDSAGVGITRVGEVTRGINESFNYNALSKFNIERNTRDMLTKSIEHAKEWGVEDIAWKRMTTRYNKNTRAWEDKKVKYESAEGLLDKLSANYDESEKIRATYPIGVVGNYENLNGYYVLTEAEQDATDMTIVSMLKDMLEEQLQAEEQGITLGSQAKDNATVDFSNAVTQVVDTPDNSMDMFNTLGSLGNVQDSDEHTEHLKSVLADVVNKVLQPTTVVLGEVNGPNRGNYFKMLSGINKIELATTVGDFWYGLSAQEVYVHEQIHNIVGYALSTGTAVVKRITAMFNAVKELVDDGTITYVDFLPEGVTNPTAEQIKDAQQRLDYVFNNTKLSVREITDPETGLKRKVKTNAALEEFVAFGTTNKAFMAILNNPKVALKLKSKLKTVRNKTKSNTLAVKLFDSMVNALLDIVQTALDMITDKIYGLDGKAMDKQLVILMSKLAGVEGKTQSKIYEYFDKASTLLPVSQAITNYILEPISKLVQSPLIKNNRFRVVRTAGNVVRAIKATKGSKLTQSLLADAMRKTRSRFNFAHDNLANSLAQELVGVTSNNRKWHKLLRLSNKYIDQLRKHISTNIKNILNEQFSYTLNKEEKESITLVGIKTDLSELLKSGYTHQEIYTLVKDESALMTAIDNARKVIEGSFSKQFTRRALRQADALANLMIIGGEVRANQNLNAHNIAHEFGMSKSRGQIDTALAEAQLDEYISLKALSLVSDDLKSKFVGIVDKEIANGKAYNDSGVSFTLEYHNQYKADALAENFGGNKVSVQKGYIKEIRDPNIAIEIAPKSREAELIALGYESTGIVVEGDYVDPSEGKMYVYVNNSAKLATNSTGIVSLTGTRAAGSKLINNMARRPHDPDTLGLDAYLDKRAIEKRMRVLADLDIAPGAVTKTGIALVPIYNLDGSIKSYRYMMSEANRKKLFNRHDSFDDVLGGMAAHVKDKVNTETINNAVVKLAKDQYDADFKKAPNDFVFVGKTSSDPELKEMWFTLPETMRMEANKVFNEGIYLKKKDLRLVMGFRKFTVGDWAKKKQQAMKDTNTIASAAATYVLTMLQKPIVGNTEEVWQELVRMAKDVIVVKTGATLLGNIMSNYAVLATEGVPLTDIVKYSVAAWKGATKYQQDKNKLDKLKVEVNAKGNLSPIQLARMNREIALLENSISTNPIYPLVEQGIYQTIVEDIEADEDTFSFKSKLEDKTSVITDYIPDSIKDVGKVLFMTHDTQLYKFMRNATQVSDFVGRFVLHQHNMNKLGMKEDASVDNIVETFINYDLPTHRSIQYLNDMGFIMFTKFFIRVQKVILRQLTTRTANVISLLLMQWALDLPVADIFDSNVLSDNSLESKLSSPISVVDTLLGVHLINAI